MPDVEKPKICFISLPGEITQSKNGFVSPLEVSPRLTEVVNPDVVDLTQTKDVVEWARLSAEVIHSRRNDYKGFVVTGYKDALQFIAPRLAFAFGPSLDKTIVVSATQIPAPEPQSAASLHLIWAAMAANTPFREVVISYNDLVLRGTNFRVGSSGYSQSISYEPYSQSQDYLGRFAVGGVGVQHQREVPKGNDTFHNIFENRIAQISIHPGLNPDFISRLLKMPEIEDMKGLVLESPSLSLMNMPPYDLTCVIDSFKRANIPVLITTTVADDQIGEELSPYQENLEGLGAILGRFMNPVVAVTKFSWAIGSANSRIKSGDLSEEQRLPQIQEIMKKPYVGEFGIHAPFTK